MDAGGAAHPPGLMRLFSATSFAFYRSTQSERDIIRQREEEDRGARDRLLRSEVDAYLLKAKQAEREHQSGTRRCCLPPTRESSTPG